MIHLSIIVVNLSLYFSVSYCSSNWHKKENLERDIDIESVPLSVDRRYLSPTVRTLASSWMPCCLPIGENTFGTVLVSTISFYRIRLEAKTNWTIVFSSLCGSSHLQMGVVKPRVIQS